MEAIIMERFLKKFKKEETYKSYKSSINGFYKYLIEEKKMCFENDKKLIENLTVDDLEDYFYYIDDEDKNYKKSTINHKIEVVKEFFTYIAKRHMTEFNLADTLELHSRNDVKEDTSEKYIPTKNEIVRLIEATYEKERDARSQEYINARDRFYIALLSTTGMRSNKEALGITMDEIELVNGGYMINIPKKRVKNKVDKRVPMPPSILKYFEEYKLQRLIFNEKYNSNLLFLSSRGNKIDSDNMNDRLEKLCRRSNIEGDITNHCFRHFLTQYLRSNGVDKSMVYKILGWIDTDVDSNYDVNAIVNKIYDKEKLRVCDVFR